MQSILIVKTSAIGDVIQSFSVLEYLRNRFPDARIDWVAEKGVFDLLSAHPLLDNVIKIDTKSWRKALLSSKTWKEAGSFYQKLSTVHYDVLFDLQGNTKSALITAAASAKDKVGFGWHCVQERPNLLSTNRRYDVPSHINVRHRYLKLVQSYFDDNSHFEQKGVSLRISAEEDQRLEELLKNPILSRPKLMVAFGSKWRNKQLSNEILEEFLLQIDQSVSPSFLFIWSNEEEKQIAEKLQQLVSYGQTVGHLSLALWQALMGRVDGVLAMDSAALHLCGTTKTPTFSVFGPSLAAVYKPPEQRHVAVQGACPYDKVFTKRCPILRTCPTGACIRHLKIEQLMNSFKLWWDSEVCC